MAGIFRARILAAAAGALVLAGCGGGSGGEFLAGTPPPPKQPTPPPPAAQAVTIFPNPQPGEYAVVGASIAASGGNLDTYASADDRFGPVSSAAANQPRIRYDDGQYEIRMPGSDWDRLVHYGGLANPTTENNYFQPSRVETNAAYLVIANAAKWDDYRYSEMGSWGSVAAGRYGAIAFGIATPVGHVPTSGSATFDGKVSGVADILQYDGLYGGYAPLPVGGSVRLDFDFAAGTLDGLMKLYGPDGMNPFLIGEFAFTDTVFSVGSTTYSGQFETAAAGDNFFLGRFTGPNAEETIGAWALPFKFTSGGEFTPADNQVHQAYGAWIARR